MPPGHAELLTLLDAHWVVHVAWPDPDGTRPVHCTPLYYARLRSGKECATAPPLLIFVSDPQTEHGRRQRDHLELGGSVALESEDLAQLRGASLRGVVRRREALPADLSAHLESDYLARHPAAAPLLRASRAAFYGLCLTWAKLTDNRRGLGNHLVLDYSGPGEPNPHLGA